MNKITKKQKTLKDFIKETTFLPDSIRLQDTYSSAYYKQKPYTEDLDKLSEIVKNISDSNKMLQDSFWDFVRNFSYTYAELDKHIELKNYYIEKYFGSLSPTKVILELESSISPIYYTGSKCAKYLLKNFKDDLKENDKEFLNKYKETRNKIFEHNLNPKEYPFIIKILYLTVFSTESELDIEAIYKDKKEERGFIDYYDDNYKLIDICIKYLKSINT